MSLPGLFGTAIGQDAQGEGGGEGGDPSRLPVKDKDLTAPPGSPSIGDRYIVASVASGAWTGHEDDIAEWVGASWVFETPLIGWITYVEDETEYYSWNGTAWVMESTGPHASTHKGGGSDEIDAVTPSLAGLMAASDKINLEREVSTGIVSGGVLSVNADPTKFDLTAGSGVIVDNWTDPDNAVVTPVSWSAKTAEAPLNLATETITRVAIDSAGSIVKQNADFTQDQVRDLIIIGAVVHPTHTAITSTYQRSNTVYGGEPNTVDLIRMLGNITYRNTYSPNGANLKLDKSLGQTYRVGVNYGVSRKRPNVSDDTAGTAVPLAYAYRDGAGGFSYPTPGTDVDPDNWDDGSGVLQSVPPNKFTIQRISHVAVPGTPGTTAVHYGQAVYASIDDAVVGIDQDRDSIVTDPLLSNASFRTWLIVKSGTTNLQNASDAHIISAGKFGDVVSGGGAVATALSAKAIVWIARKATAGTIPKGAPVYIAGYDAGNYRVLVEAAQANSSATMPAIGVAFGPITATADGFVINSGALLDVDTSSWPIGTELYVSAAAGVLTDVKPQGTDLVQKVAQVARQDATDGMMGVFGAGRVNDLPNLASGKVWKGDGSGVPQEVDFVHAATHKNGGADEVATATAGANLIPKADVTGKLDIGWMPASLVGALQFQGFWNASTNTPTLADGTGTLGQFYVVDTAGSQDLGSGSISYNIGDWVLHDGSVWGKIDHTDQVASVFGRLGVVTAQSGDYTHAEIASVGADDHHNQQHALGGVDHTSATLAELNAKVSDATLDDSGDPRDPKAHALGGTDHTAATLAELNAKVSDATLIAAWDEAQLYYVGKHGLDTNDGKSVNEALLTITAAIAKAVALTPSTTNRFTIRVVDAAVYTESISVPPYVFVDAANAKLVGTLTFAGSPSAADFSTINPPTGTDAVVCSAPSDCYLKTKFIQVIGAGGTGIKQSAGNLVVDVGYIDADDTCNGVWVTGGVVCGKIGRLDVVQGVGVYVTDSPAQVYASVDVLEVGNAAGKGIFITSAGGAISRVGLQVNRVAGNGTFIDLDAGSAHVYVGLVDGATTLYNLSGASSLYLFGGKLSGTRISTTSGDEKVTEAGVAPLHADTHKDGGADELDVEELATAGADGTLPTSDGAGAVVMRPHDPVKWYDAASLDSPDGTSDVPSSMDAAPIISDSIASNIPVRVFDDVAEEGVLLKSTTHVPVGSVNMSLNIAGHATSAPQGSTRYISIVLYARKHNAGSARGAWSAGAVAVFTVPDDTYDIITSVTKTIAAWGLSAGDEFQILVSRDPLHASDTLSDEFELREIGLRFQ